MFCAQLKEIDANLLDWPVGTTGTTAYVDNWILRTHPKVMYEAGDVHVTRAIVGATSMDGLAPWMQTYGAFIPLSARSYNTAVEHYWKELSEQVLKMYPLLNFANNSMAAFVQADADASVVCPTLALAALMKAAGVEVYHYAFEYGPHGADAAVSVGLVPSIQESGVNLHWASHTSEIPLVFQNVCGKCWINKRCISNTACVSTRGWSSADDSLRLAEQMAHFWGSFAHARSPEARNASTWPSLKDAHTIPTMVFDAPMSKVTYGYRAKLCSLWASTLG